MLIRWLYKRFFSLYNMIFKAHNIKRMIIRDFFVRGYFILFVSIFNLLADDEHMKFFTPIISISVRHSSRKSATPFTKTGGGGLIGTISSMSISLMRKMDEFVLIFIFSNDFVKQIFFFIYVLFGLLGFWWSWWFGGRRAGMIFFFYSLHDSLHQFCFLLF